eukprot:2968251-Rhodomonas_salina.1
MALISERAGVQDKDEEDLDEEEAAKDDEVRDQCRTASFPYRLYQQSGLFHLISLCTSPGYRPARLPGQGEARVLVPPTPARALPSAPSDRALGVLLRVPRSNLA